MARSRPPANPGEHRGELLDARHAFDAWDSARVELKTDSRNTRSRRAIERIGATEEGTMRKHMQTHQGTRDTVYFSVVDDE